MDFTPRHNRKWEVASISLHLSMLNVFVFFFAHVEKTNPLTLTTSRLCLSTTLNVWQMCSLCCEIGITAHIYEALDSQLAVSSWLAQHCTNLELCLSVSSLLTSCFLFISRRRAKSSRSNYETERNIPQKVSALSELLPHWRSSDENPHFCLCETKILALQSPYWFVSRATWTSTPFSH